MFSPSILLCDHYLMFREALRALLNRESDLRVVAEAGDRAEAQRIAAALWPALAVVEMTHLGPAAVRDIVAVSPATAVLALGDAPASESVVEAFAAGATGFALKTQRGAEVAAALRIIRSGQRYLAPGLVAPGLAARVRRVVRGGLLDG